MTAQPSPANPHGTNQTGGCDTTSSEVKDAGYVVSRLKSLPPANPHGRPIKGCVTTFTKEQTDAGYVVSRPPANPNGTNRFSLGDTKATSDENNAGYVVSRLKSLPPANPNGTNRFSDTKATNAQPDAGYVVSRLKHSSLTGGSLIPIAQASIPQFLLVKKSPRNLEGTTHVVTVCPVSIGDCFRRRLVMSACLGVTCDC